MLLLKLVLVRLTTVGAMLYAPTLSVPEVLVAGLAAPRLKVATVLVPSVTVTSVPLTEA